MATNKKATSPFIVLDKPALVLRISRPDGLSRNGFYWPTEGPVTCPDWLEEAECGNGLHGWLHGEGDHGVADSELFTMPDALWLAVEVTSYIELQGKVKFPAGMVVCSGDRLKVTEYLRANGCNGAIIGATQIAGDEGTATAGDAGTATAGYAGTATAGNEGTATAGNRGTILIKRWNGKRYRFALGNIGEDTDATGAVLEANVAYKLNDEGQFIKA